jgi:hypothetical protein
MVSVRGYYFFPRGRGAIRERLRGRLEAIWLTATLGMLAQLHFGAVLAYIAWPSLLAWSAVRVAEPIRWVAIVISCAGAVGHRR